MAFTMNTTLAELLAEPRIKPVLDQYVPGVAGNPMVTMIQGMTLNQLIAMPQAAQFGITKDKVELILVEANKLVG